MKISQKGYIQLNQENYKLYQNGLKGYNLKPWFGLNKYDENGPLIVLGFYIDLNQEQQSQESTKLLQEMFLPLFQLKITTKTYRIVLWALKFKNLKMLQFQCNTEEQFKDEKELQKMKIQVLAQQFQIRVLAQTFTKNKLITNLLISIFKHFLNKKQLSKIVILSGNQPIKGKIFSYLRQIQKKQKAI